MSAITKKEIIRATQATLEADFGLALSLDKINSVIRSYNTVIAQELSDGNEVRIDYVGLLSPRLFKATTARNLKTGDTVQVPATHRVRFRAVPSLKTAVKALPVPEAV
ncbi:MAG: HU family DNA-binding protein [Cytophagales bacterium]|jgi:nucleoid DNA-binding protein|nr:HU family DNA-binding protein [Cytophagales bacterium]